MRIKIEPVFIDGFLDGYARTEEGYKKIRDISFVDRVHHTITLKGLSSEGEAELRDFIARKGKEEHTDIKWEKGKPIRIKRIKHVIQIEE